MEIARARGADDGENPKFWVSFEGSRQSLGAEHYLYHIEELRTQEVRSPISLQSKRSLDIGEHKRATVRKRCHTTTLQL